MFGIKLKQLRKERGITQEQLAAIIGVERSSIGKYESMNNPVQPSTNVMIKISEYFNVSLDYLLSEEKDSDYILSRDEEELLSDYRSLTIQGKEFIRQTMVAALNTYKKSNPNSDLEVGRIG